MYGVVAPDADAVRRLIPTVQDLLEWPYCSYLFYLARHVDQEAIAFLARYAQAVHDETGEAIAVIVLFDDIEVLGEVRGWERRDPDANDSPRVVDDPQIAYGSYPFPQDRVPQRTTRELLTASPRWSLKFADALGLSRSFVPCIVAFDNAESEDCVVLDLSNADHAWETLRDAIASFMAAPASQHFVMAAERLRTLTRDLRSDKPESPQPFYWMPTTPGRLLHVLSQPSHPNRASVIDMISRSPAGMATALNRFVDNVAVLKAVVNYEACVDRLRRSWVNAEFRLGSAPAHVVRRLTDASHIVGQDASAAEINHLLTSDAAGRSQFVESVEQAGRAELAAIAEALRTIRASTLPKELRLRAEIEAIRSSLIPEPFLPHLAAAIESASGLPGAATRGSKLTLRKRIVGATSFGASLAQILQSIGAIR
jgi:hypothetical protein